MIQNTAAKAVGLYKNDHQGNSTLKELHWLLIRFRIVFKIILLVFKWLNGLGPDYICEMLHFANSDHFIYFVEPRTVSTFGDRSFQKGGPKLWNKLPLHIKTWPSLELFGPALKTFLFKKAFEE